MLTFVILVAIVLAGFSHDVAAICPRTNMFTEMRVPRGQTREQYVQSIIDYWTPERMASAIPRDVIVVDESELPKFDSPPQTAKAATILTPSSLKPGMSQSGPPIAGKVYFSMAGLNYICSGSVITSENRSTVVTAGHCIYDYERQIWASTWIFVPQYSLGSRPLGTFTMRTMATKTGWADSRNFDCDVGLVIVNTNDKGQPVQDVAGGLGVTLDATRDVTTIAYGYPRNINNGEIVSNCVNTPLSPTFLSGFTGLQLSCGMTGGASGGPWIQAFDVDALTGQQISVNSFIVTNLPNYLFGPYFNDDNIGVLYRELHSK